MGNRLEGLHPVVSEHSVLKHPFLTAFEAGELTREQVAGWFAQQFYFLTSLPNAFAALYARIPDTFLNEKRRILSIIDIESWGSTNPSAHTNTYREVAEYLGLNIEELAHGAPKPYTKKYLDFRFKICSDPERPLSEGLAAIALGNEMLNIGIYQAYKNGIPKIAGMEKCPMAYFDVHVHDEESDCKVFSSVFDALVKAEPEMHGAEKVLRELLNWRVEFFDELFNDISAKTQNHSAQIASTALKTRSVTL